MKTVEELKQMKYDITRKMGDYLECLTEWTTYIEEHEREEGDLYRDLYQKGLEDAWKLARKVILSPSEEGMTAEEILECFNVVNELCVLRSPVSVAKEMYDTWKANKEQQKDDEIHVGDEVRWNHMYELMVVVKKVNDHYGLIHLSDGSYDNSDGCHLVKTGKHYDLPWLKECQ